VRAILVGAIQGRDSVWGVPAINWNGSNFSSAVRRLLVTPTFLSPFMFFCFTVVFLSSSSAALGKKMSI
jgi:hypothetical protein